MTDNLRALDTPPQHPRPPEGRHRVQMDLTINIPTIITLVTIMAGVITFGVKTYNDLAAADANQQRDISMLRVDVDRVSAAQADTAKEVRVATETLRKENREDFREVRSTLEDINRRLSPSSPATLRGWTK